MRPTADGASADDQRTIADLRRELDEALAREAALAEVLGVINSSPGELAPVFDAMLEKTMRLCGASFGILRTYDGALFHTAAAHGVPAAYGEFLIHNPQLPAAGTSGARILAGDPAVHIVDLAEAAPYRAGEEHARAMVELGGARTSLAVPLTKEGSILGAFQIYRQEVYPFTDKQIALLQNFAAQAVIAMENARLITEMREALEQQTATAEVLGVINSSPGDLQPVFAKILEKAYVLCDASGGDFVTYDGEYFHSVAMQGMTEQFGQTVMQQPYSHPPDHPLHILVRGEQRVVHIADTVVELAELMVVDPMTRAAVEQGGVRTVLMVPLRKDDTLLGVIIAQRREVRPFSDRQIALMESFAAQAVIAMENARLLTETRERTRDLQESLEYQTATSDVLAVISRSTFDLQPVLDTLVETAARLCRAENATIFRVREDRYHLAASFGFEFEFKDFLVRHPISPGRGTAVGRVVLEHRAVHIEDAATDPEYTQRERQQLGQYHTMLAVPLFRESTMIGVIGLSRLRVEPFTEREVALVTTFADQAVIAMENARLLGELRQRTDEVAELNRALEARVAEQVEELSRVGRLKRFLAPQLAELIVSQGDEKILESHRREIVVVFCDLRGYTAFTETAEPEEVLDFLREYHGALGPLVSQFEGTLDQFSGDGIMVFFNDPVPIPDPAARAVQMAVAMRDAASSLIAAWRRHGSELGFGVGIAQGYATLGQIGFSERSGYTAIGTVCNLAARLCAEAKDGQILVSSRVADAVQAVARLEDLGSLELKGLSRPVAAFNVPLSAGEPALRVLEGGPPSV